MKGLGIILRSTYDKRIFLRVYLPNLITIFLVMFLGACTLPKINLITGNTMGTTYSVKVVDKVDVEVLKKLIDQKLIDVNQLMSTYIPDSELSRFNQAPINQFFPLSKENIDIMRIAEQIYNVSGGQFDITIGPLVNLWGFGSDVTQQVLPSQGEIDLAKSRVSMDLLNISNEGAIKKANIYIDLSAIAKGYGVDQIALLLEARGINNYLVEIGGELRAKGVNEKGYNWRIGIEKPDASQRTAFKAIELRDQAMATSGDYRNYFEVAGQRYSHTISPLTGRPITHNVASVTVVAKTTAMADGYATAINVMGAEQGLEMAERQSLAVLVILKTDNGYEERYSEAFKALSSDSLELD